jgi:hypothetical protein
MQTLGLQFIYLNDKLGFAVNYRNVKGVFPISSYYFWPISKAWEQLQFELNLQTWISSKEQTQLLNVIVELMDDWQRLKDISNRKQLMEKKFDAVENVQITGYS